MSRSEKAAVIALTILLLGLVVGAYALTALIAGTFAAAMVAL